MDFSGIQDKMYHYKMSWMGKSRNEKETKTAQKNVQQCTDFCAHGN